MEIIIAILGYLLHCFTAFALIFSCDKAKIWGDANSTPRLHMPKISDIDDDEEDENDEAFQIPEPHKESPGRWLFFRKQIYRGKAQEYVDKEIRTATFYFKLRNEIEYYQSNYDIGLGQGSLLQLFSIGIIFRMFIRMEVFDSWIASALIVASVCAISSGIVYLIYNRYWRCRSIRIKHFQGFAWCDRTNNEKIQKHYDYLCSIEETVIFRHYVRKILSGAMIIILILFMPTPEY